MSTEGQPLDNGEYIQVNPTPPSDSGNDGGAPATPSNVFDNNEGDDKQASPQTFPDNWQKIMSGEDEKIEKLLGRYASPVDVAKALKQANATIDSKLSVKAPSAESSEEEVTQWRKSLGIPENHNEYEIKLENGYVPGDDDKPIIDGFLEKAHGKNFTPEQANTALEFYYEHQENLQRQINEANQKGLDECEDVLRMEWGNQYRNNLNVASGFLTQTFGEDGASALQGAVGADGVMLMHNPDIVKALANLGLQNNPRVTYPTGTSSGQDVDTRMKEIENIMGTPKYYKDPSIAEEYRKLIEFKQKM